MECLHCQVISFERLTGVLLLFGWTLCQVLWVFCDQNSAQMSSIRVQQTWKIMWLIVLKWSLYVVKEWPHQPKRHRVQTQSSWRGQGRFGKLAPRQSGRFHPANPVSYRPNVLTERILNHETHFPPPRFCSVTHEQVLEWISWETTTWRLTGSQMDLNLI